MRNFARQEVVIGKRSSFERIPRDFYRTPPEAVAPLLPHLLEGTQFIEPCAGDGALADTLIEAGHICTGAWDIEPRGENILDVDSTQKQWWHPRLFITNPPWDRKILHPLIINLSDQAPTWLLFDADWMHTRQSAPFMDRLRAIVSVGRVKWIPDSTMTGKDNCCWYLFDKPSDTPTQFYGRVGQ